MGDLVKKTEIVRDETLLLHNTSTRVGGVLVEIAGVVEGNALAIDKQNTTTGQLTKDVAQSKKDIALIKKDVEKVKSDVDSLSKTVAEKADKSDVEKLEQTLLEKADKTELTEKADKKELDIINETIDAQSFHYAPTVSDLYLDGLLGNEYEQYKLQFRQGTKPNYRTGHLFISRQVVDGIVTVFQTLIRAGSIMIRSGTVTTTADGEETATWGAWSEDNPAFTIDIIKEIDYEI